MTSASTTALVLIGWDDIKGRPIYSKKQQQASSSSSAVPAKKKTKASVKKKGTRSSNLVFGKNHQRGGNRKKKNGNIGRRNIPTVQVAVGSLLSSFSGGTTDNVVFSFNDPPSQINPSETALKPSAARRRKVSFSPTISSKSDNDITNNDSSSSKSGFVPSVKKSWDSKKRKQGYGSKKFSRGSSTGYISPVFGLDGVVDVEDDGDVGWNRDAFASSSSSPSVGSNDDCDDGMLSVESEPERLDDNIHDKNLSTENEEDFLTSIIPRDIQSDDGHDSMTSSLDNNQSLGSEEERNDGNGSSFSYGDLDKRDDFVNSPSIQLDDSIPEMIHVEADVPVTNEGNDDDLTVKAKDEEPISTKTTNGIGHNDTPSKTVDEETSYKLHSGGTNDFIDYDIPLDDTSHTDNNKIHGKKRSYGCTEKPVWVSSKKRGAKTASAVTTADNAVGWDEGKCRPIFHVKTKKNVAHENATLDECNDDEDAGIDFASDDANDATMKSHKRRQYSSRFRKTSLTKAIEKMSVLTNPKEAEDHSDSCNEQEDCSTDDANGDNENDEANVKSDMDLDLEIEDVVNDENARHIQPTESSSLEAARAFFRYLDSNHRLIVDQTDASPRISSEVIRTTRRIVHSDQLQTEYSEYCDMLAQTGVAPISITEFANNWNRYFVGKGIRDGLFDED